MYAAVLMLEEKYSDFKPFPLAVYTSESYNSAIQAAQDGAANHAKNFDYFHGVKLRDYDKISITLHWVELVVYESFADTSTHNYYVKMISEVNQVD